MRDHDERRIELGAGCTPIPEADLGPGFASPPAIASIRPGETVIDLGAGAGFDCLLAAERVGPNGRVIGVDMTSGMVMLARENARRVGACNVEFRLGEIEHLPVADSTADVIVSNCVISLSPDKQAVFHEAFRVLKFGGRLAITDVVATGPMPAELAQMVETLTGCPSGATTLDDLTRLVTTAGFIDVRVTIKPESRKLIRDWMPGSAAEKYIVFALIQSEKPTIFNTAHDLSY